MYDQITPLVLTFNEEPNIGRTLSALRWARRVVVVDSYSTDRTLEIVRGFENACVVQRRFDRFEAQWNFGLDSEWIETDWVLAMDADWFMTDELAAELRDLRPEPGVTAYWVQFRFCIDGKPLRASLYPRVAALFRRGHARFEQDGHTQRLRVLDGRIGELKGRMLHDDRKPFSRWLLAQKRYARDEVAKLRASSFAELPWQDRVRLVPFLSGPLSAMHCLFLKGCLFDGRAGFRYAGLRVLAEWVISLELIDRR